MSALPTSVTTAAKPAKNTPPAKTAANQPQRIAFDEKLSARTLRELMTEPAAATKPKRKLKANAILYRCTTNIYPDYRSWQTTCADRTEPSIGCQCTEAPA